ncbi:ANK1, partial [Symbiodinium natans]
MSKGIGTKVPENFNEMFTFNAAVMGFAGSLGWMNPVLDQFEAMVLNAANSYRLQEECDVLALVLVKYKEPIIYAEFKAIMLASLRSLVPKIWGVEHEVAWTWFWDNTERMIKRQTAGIKGYQRAADKFIRNLSDDIVQQMRRDVYKVFFGVAPKGQDYFKQSSTRLNFIADKVLEMSLEMYKRPREMVEEISALGLRHVGYGIPTELFPPFIEAWSQVLQMMLVDEKAANSLRWSLTLISKILVRTILEGSTIVMKAINTNSAKRFRKAIAIAGRSQRAMDMLRITVGTQSISPLDWAIKSGSFQVARAMIDDLLTIRGDRDNYYYGCDALFERHPDILNILSATRGQGLLPALLDGMLWRSKHTQNKLRRVNYFVKHLIQDAEGLFNAKQISVIIKSGDPKLMRHPVVSFVFNMLWSRLASYEFLQSRVLFMVQVVIFVCAQSILPRLQPKRETESLRILLFSCRCVIYFFDMFVLLCAHIKYIVADIREGSLTHLLGLPCPAYLKNLASAAQLAMGINLVFMCTQEPIFHCLGNMYGNYEGAGLFSTHCPEAQTNINVYSVFSQLGVLLHWLLLVDCCIFSLRLSSYFLTCFYVLVELLHFLCALLFLVLMFACSITALDNFKADFRSIPAGVRTLTKITLGMYPSEKFIELHNSPRLLGLLIVFIVIVVIFLLNLLIAQLAGAYRNVYGDMMGFARLFRSGITVSTVRAIRPKRWTAFLKSLRFQERIEFNEGDVGIAGGIQVLELATLNPTTE